jgi:16S rRNA (uracil1498-N3)-methyltransferase
MRIHRFYIENIDINPEKTVVTQETELIHQLKNVFRYKLGQKIYVFNEKIGEIEVEISEIGKKDVSFKYIGHTDNVFDDENGKKRQLSLYMSIIKNSNFELMVEKAVELGVFEIIPVITERTIKNNLNIQRINKIIKEATEQSGRVDLTKMGETVDLFNAIKKSKITSDMVYFGSLNKSDDLDQIKGHSRSKIAIFIGPEGGYSDEELSLFIDNEIRPLRLGRYVLRAETAAIVACGLMSL